MQWRLDLNLPVHFKIKTNQYKVCSREGKVKSVDQWQPEPASHLGAIQADDTVDVACAVVEIGNSDSVLAGGQPVLLGVGVNLEDMGPRAVDGLLPEGNKKEVMNLFVPQHQRVTKATTSIQSAVVRTPWQPDFQMAIVHSYATERGIFKVLVQLLIVLCTSMIGFSRDTFLM